MIAHDELREFPPFLGIFANEDVNTREKTEFTELESGKNELVLFLTFFYYSGICTTMF